MQAPGSVYRKNSQTAKNKAMLCKLAAAQISCQASLAPSDFYFKYSSKNDPHSYFVPHHRSRRETS